MSSSPTYPGDRSNDPESNSYPFRDLSVINQPSGGLEFVNTKDDEMVTIYYKDGSYTRFNKLSMDTLATKDKREHVMGESRIEIDGNTVNMHNQDVENIILGDKLNKVGDIDKWQTFQDKIKKLVKTSIQPIKQLFEVKRTKSHNSIDQSSLQTKSGTFASNPSSDISAKTLVSTTDIAIDYATKGGAGRTIFKITQQPADTYQTVTADTGWGDFTSYGLGTSPSTQDGTWDSETQKDQLTQKRIDIQNQLFDNEKHLGQNKHRDGGTEINKVAKDRLDIIGLSFNDSPSFRKDPFGKLVPHGIKIDPMGASVYVQYRPTTLVENVHVEDLAGGNYDITACQKHDLTVGSGGINMKTTGPMDVYSPITNIVAEDLHISSNGELGLAAERVDISGEVITLRPSKVRRVIEDSSGSNVENLPVNNDSKTEAEQQVLVAGNLGVELNTIMKGGLHVEGELSVHHITCPAEYHITESDFEYGESTACSTDPTVDKDNPCATSEPTKGPTYADMLEGCIIGKLVNLQYSSDADGEGLFLIAADVQSVACDSPIMVHSHHHPYKLPPTKFIEQTTDFDITVGNNNQSASLNPHDAIRAIGSRNNYIEPVLSLPVKNDYTNFSSSEKFGGTTPISNCGSITLNNGTWNIDDADASLLEDTLPNGEGVRTSKYTYEELESRVSQLESLLETKYKELSNKLDSLTN